MAHIENGRDSRTRTYACQNQNLVPYRLGYIPIVNLQKKMGWVVGFEPTTFSATN